MTDSIQSVDTDVLIVGAGPTGLVLAVELLRRGITCRVVDKLAGPSATSRAIDIHARTLELFEQMDIVEPFLSQGWKSHAFQVYNKDKQIVRMTFGELDTKYPYVLCLVQSETERILSEALSTKGGAIEWNTELLSFTQSLEGVTARIQKTGEKETTISSKWLVGCDGAHSLIRKLLDIGFPGTPYWEQFVLADIDFETSLDPSEHYLFSTEEGVVGFHPFSSTKARIFAELGRIKHSRKISDSMPSQSGQFAEPNLEELQSILDRRGPGKVKIKAVNWITLHTIHRRQVKAYKHGRILLAGDAAHVHSPTSAQGMNLGIQDSYNLAWKLALVEKDLARQDLLESYSLERGLICRRVSAMSDFFTRVNNMRSSLAQKIRNSVGPKISEVQNVRKSYRNAVSELSIDYGFSSIVGESVARDSLIGMVNNLLHTKSDHLIDWQSAPKPGERALDATLTKTNGEKIRLYDLFKSTEHQLLLFTGLNSLPISNKVLLSIAEFAEQNYGKQIDSHLIVSPSTILEGTNRSVNQLNDPDLNAHRKYGASSVCLFLVRPDGYIAYRAIPPSIETFQTYLQSIFKLK